MDVRQYYRKVREVESTLTEQYVVLISLETADGGKSGMMSEVPREIAAKMIVEGRAVVAGESDRKHYFDAHANAKKAARKAELARRVQVVLADPDVENPDSDDKVNIPSGKK